MKNAFVSSLAPLMESMAISKRDRSRKVELTLGWYRTTLAADFG
jgi:hypothetical protein